MPNRNLSPAPPASQRRPWRGALACLRPYGLHLVLVGILLGAGTLLNLIPPLLVRRLIDQGIPEGQAAASPLPVLPYLVGLLLVPCAASLTLLVQDYLSTRVGLGVLSDLRNRLFNHWQARSLGFFTSTPAGELTARLGDDASRVGFAVAEVVPLFLNLACLVTGTLAVLFIVCWPLAVLASLTLAPFLLLARRAGSRRRELATRVQDANAALLSVLHDVLNVGGFLVMYLFNRTQAEARRFADLDAEQRRLRLRLLLTARGAEALLSPFAAFGAALVYGYGGWLVIRGSLSLGTVIAVAGYLSALYGPINQLADLYGSLQEALGVLGRLLAALDEPPAVCDRADAVTLPPVRGEVRFENVTFAYGPDQQPALREVSLTIRPGQLAALVGPSGAGKTTLHSLLPRFYDPQEGCVRIDGLDLRAVTHTSLLAQLGLVPQEAYLFHATVRSNLLYARPDASQADLEAACRTAQIHEVIRRLPHGYDTVVGERGVKLSAGERQRLSLARVLLKDPRLLLLDEATSALDVATERLLQQTLAPFRRGRTTLVIAHRLSTVMAADLLMVLDSGRLVESGSHEELLQRGGL